MKGDDPTAPIVVVTHGWGDSRVTMLGRAEVLAKFASRVVLWDLPGHGDAPGRCTLGAKEPEDLRALLATLQGEGPVDVPLVLYGFSLGAGVSIVAAGGPEGLSVAGVIAEAPYRVPATPARAVLRQAGMPYRWNLPLALWWVWLRLAGGLRDGTFDRTFHAVRVATPLLVLHGESDEICPVQDGESIAAAAPKGRAVRIAGGDHLGLWSNPSTATVAAEACGLFLQQIPRGTPE
jgi:pimeloyl-ACP methyl ester carboxylesterase